MKTCKSCNKSYPATIEYFYKNKSSQDGLHPYCKDCAKVKGNKRYRENRDSEMARRKRWYEENKEHSLKRQKITNEKNKESNKINQSIWRRENKNKIKEYQEERKLHKNHDISNEELNQLYMYANYSCMYCGISELEAKEIYGQRLHKDHAINEGSDKIDNCVLACRSCNSSKHDKDWDAWFTPDNPKYTQQRYNKIKEWLDKFKI